jgi:Mycotoxin biosynthesis protein UstYa
MTYNWQAEKPWPNPDFEVTHKCRNFDAILNWVNDTPRSRRELVMKPEDAPIKPETHGH